MTYHFNFDQLRNLSIGTVDYVSPQEIKVLLEPDAPQNTALNTGVPGLFPRLNGFVLIPNEIGALVGIIGWLGVEHSQYPKRKGLKDYDLIDLPFPLRKMAINPIGTLKTEINDGETIYKLERGIYSFPSIGDTVVLAKNEQLKSIVENDDENAFVKIGTAPIAGDANVNINPDKLFGRHIAVLGNTGSGKSCSVAGLIRWSLEEADKRKVKEGKLNARFIVLDPNGEYGNCFSGLNIDVKRFKVELTEAEKETFQQLKVPGWFWNSYEWGAFSQATGRTQRPILRRALKELKGGNALQDDVLLHIRRYLSSALVSFRSDRNTGVPALSDKKSEFGGKLRALAKDTTSFVGRKEGEINGNLTVLSAAFDEIADRKAAQFTEKGTGVVVKYFNPFEMQDAEDAISALETFLETVGGIARFEGPDEDMPIRFDIDDLPDHIEQIAQEQGALQFLDFFIMRIRTMISDNRMASIIADDEDISLESWLNKYMSGIVVLDLSLVPADLLHLIVAVVSRVVFEATQRYRRMFAQILPTVLVLEEAHNFIKKHVYSDDISPAEVCSQVFERVAKEGRKFGLSLMLSSQRPSELSDTVLSQCNTFMLHRIVNDRDQDLVRRLVPDNIGGLLKELPILPTRKAILLGWASPIPILVEVNELAKEFRPRSDDPDFWDVWTHNSSRDEKWSQIATEWAAVEDFSAEADTQTQSETSNPITSEEDIAPTLTSGPEDDDLPF